MGALFNNNAYSTLASGISDVATSITVAAGHGARFPSPSGSTYFYATLINTSNQLEIVKCTSRSTDTLTVTRAQESTTARAYSTGDRIELRLTAAGLAEIGLPLDGTPGTDHTASGPHTSDFQAAGSITVMGLVYLNSSSQWAAADADALATAGSAPLGISLETKTVGVAMDTALPGSFVRDDTWDWTPGAPLYVSETAGGISASVPTGVDGIVRVVGFAVTADIIYFDPAPYYITIDANGNIKNVTGIAPPPDIPQNSKSAAYTTVAADAGKHIYHPGADTTARTWTIDSNANVAYPVGTALTFVNDLLGGVITIAITSDTLVLAGAGSTGSRTLAAGGMATVLKVTTTRWIIAGTGLT